MNSQAHKFNFSRMLCLFALIALPRVAFAAPEVCARHDSELRASYERITNITTGAETADLWIKEIYGSLQSTFAASIDVPKFERDGDVVKVTFSANPRYDITRFSAAVRAEFVVLANLVANQIATTASSASTSDHQLICRSTVQNDTQAIFLCEPRASARELIKNSLDRWIAKSRAKAFACLIVWKHQDEAEVQRLEAARAELARLENERQVALQLKRDQAIAERLRLAELAKEEAAASAAAAASSAEARRQARSQPAPRPPVARLIEIRPGISKFDHAILIASIDVMMGRAHALEATFATCRAQWKWFDQIYIDRASSEVTKRAIYESRPYVSAQRMKGAKFLNICRQIPAALEQERDFAEKGLRDFEDNSFEEGFAVCEREIQRCEAGTYSSPGTRLWQLRDVILPR